MTGYRVAVVSPLSPFGRRIRALLDRSDPQPLPVLELKLFDGRANAGSTLAQFEDEVLVTQALDVDLFPFLDVMYVAEETSSEVLAKAAAAADQGVLTLVAGGQVEAPVAAVGLNDRFLPDGVRFVGLPSAASLLLGKVLEALGAGFEIERSLATVMLPASELGEKAVEELHQQVVRLLNFGSPPTDVIGDQLAFNLLALADKAGRGSVSRPELAVAKEACELAGLEEGRLSVFLTLAPVFHGYSVSLWVQLAEQPTVEAVVAALAKRADLDASQTLEPHDASAPVVSPVGPVGVTGSKQVHVGRVLPDGTRRGAFWLWLAADSAAVDSAQNALELSTKLLRGGETPPIR